MVHVGTLWGDLRQRQTKVIFSIAALNELELTMPPFSFQEKPAEFLDKFRYGKIPAFEGTDGFKLIEGTPIARYLSGIGTKINLLGRNAQETAIVDQWVHFAEHEINAPAYGISALIRGLVPFSREAMTLDKHTEQLARALKHLESHLATRPSGYVASDTLTYADLVLVGTIYAAARVALGTAERAQYPHVFAHYARVTGHEKVAQYWGTDGFVQERLTEPNPV